MYPGGKNENVDLRNLVDYTVPFKLSKQLLENPENLEATKICQICRASMNNIQMEPCLHLLCNQCVKKWLVSDIYFAAAYLKKTYFFNHGVLYFDPNH